MDISKFIVEQGIISITIGSIIGFAFTNYMRSFREHIIVPFIFKTFHLRRYFGEFLSASIELSIILLTVFGVYRYIIFPLLSKELKREKEKIEDDAKWRSNLLGEVRSIDDKIYNVNYGLF
jgi:large-conductance mechanosensitive channel